MAPYTIANLAGVIERWQRRRVLVIGDSGIDEYVTGEVRRISPEAPVPIVEADREDRTLGLAANVAQNIKTLGGEAQLISVIGEDGGAELLKELLQRVGIDPGGLVVDSDRPTTRKMRVMARTWRGDENHMLRLDFEKRHYLSAALQERVLERYRAALAQAEIVILQDYAKGMVTESFAQAVIDLGRRAGRKVLVDPHRNTPLKFYRGAYLIKPNLEEAIALLGGPTDGQRRTPEMVEGLGQRILQETGVDEVVITEGREGMSLFAAQGTVKRVPTYAQQVFDVTGAGDTVIATLALALTSAEDLEAACQLANFAAGVVVGKYGCVPCHAKELLVYMYKHGAT